MAFTRIRTIKGHDYLYREERWREGGKVHSRSVCLGRAAGERKIDWRATLAAPPHGFSVEARLMAGEAERLAREKAAFDNAVGELHTQFGLTVGPSNPVSVEKPASPVVVATPAAPAAAPAALDAPVPSEAPAAAGDEGEASGQEGASPSDGEADSQ